MYKDYTIKARLYSAKEIENTLAQLNSKFIGVDLQTDTYFETTHGKLKLRQGTIENLITHYERTREGNAEKTNVYRYDINPTKEEIEKLKNTHRVIGSVEKERKIYYIDHIKIHIDKLENKAEYIEIEAIDRQNLFSNEELKRHCLDVKEKLGIRESDVVQTGYLKL